LNGPKFGFPRMLELAAVIEDLWPGSFKSWVGHASDGNVRGTVRAAHQRLWDVPAEAIERAIYDLSDSGLYHEAPPPGIVRQWALARAADLSTPQLPASFAEPTEEMLDLNRKRWAEMRDQTLQAMAARSAKAGLS
jgi:hypothetical protein